MRQIFLCGFTGRARHWRDSALAHFPTVFVLLSTFGLVATLYDFEKLIATNPKVDTLMYIDGAIIWHLKKKDYRHSKINDLIGTDVYKNMTVRNINTVRKLNELTSE